MSKFRLGITSWLAVLLLVFVAGCGEEAVTVPLVVSTIPANGATAVAVNTPISATFSMAMNPSSISATSFTVAGPGGAVAGAVAFSGLTATFTPAAALAYGATYTGTITTGATDLGGTPLQANYVWTFSTIAPTPPPTVISTIPVNTATGVPLNQVLSATFSEAMSCATLASPAASFVLTGPGATPVAGAVSCAGAVATFTPAADLVVNTVYTATITTGAEDLDGTPLGANYVWTFRTLPAPTPPTVISTVPANRATGVPVNQALSATFSVAMTPATIDTTTFTLAGPGGAVTGVVTYVAAGSVATFTPGTNLAPSTVYTATITTGAEDLAGVGLAANYVWTFTTAASVVLTPPTVTSTIPVNAATGVPLNQIVSATFSVPMNAATINSATFTLTGPGATSVAGLVAYAAVGNTLTFTPTTNLTASTLYTATITTGAKDLAGIGLAANYVWTFTTGTAVVAVPPEIVSTVPASGATGVPLNQAVSVTFSEAMNPLTLTTGTFLLYQGTSASGTPIPATITYDAVDFIATLTPTAPLTASTSYTATVTSGATNLAGTPLGTTGAPNPWTFTTGTAVLAPPVVLGSTISLFGAFGGTAGITNQGIETVVNGDIGTTAVSTKITGFHDTSVVVSGVDECTYTETPLNIGLVNGVIDTAPPPPTVGCPNEGTAVTFAAAQQGALEALAAYNTLAAIPNGLDVSVCPGCGGGGAGELGNRTLAPGTYKSAAGSYAISMGDLTLDAKGDPTASWVFQMATTLTVGTPSAHRNVLLVNGAQASNVFWQVGSAATINGILGGGTMAGTIIAQNGVSISTAGVNAITTVNGRAIVLVGPVTMVNTVINVP
jgi:Ice-binding-like/Bacterial Ig-like domain